MTKTYTFKGWEIKGCGGFCTVRHFWATKGDLSFWRFKLKEVKAYIEQIENGEISFEDIHPIYRKSLY